MNLFCFLTPPVSIHAGDAFDFLSREVVLLHSKGLWKAVVKVPLGVKSRLDRPVQLLERSGMVLKYPFLALGAGLIDPGYRGEWHALFRIHPHLFQGDPEGLLEERDGDLYLKAGVRVVQAILPQDFQVVPPEAWDHWETLHPSTRGVGGFGSTGFSL